MKSRLEVFVKENIEMELFSSEESCVVTKTQEEQQTGPHQRHVEHPLASGAEEDLGRRRLSRPSVTENQEASGALQDRLIEMEVLRSLEMSKYKWKKQPPQKSRFVVKDVVFVPRDQYLAQIERQEASPVTARMTVDHGWTPAEMDNRLRLVLRREFGKAAARSISFTYLQCVQSSRSLFVPPAPEEGWSGAHVLRFSALGPLYVLIHQDGSQLRNELQRVLTSFTHEAPGVELPLQVRRTAALPSALKAVRMSSFCFRNIPVVSFSGEETEGPQGPLREFFRLMLEELQRTSLFKGQPGRLLLTSDLSALEDWGYFEAGVLIGWSLAHGGAGPRCLHPALFQLMCGRSSSLDDFSWRDVVDFEIQSHLQQLQSCSDVRLLSPRVRAWVSRCGVSELSSETTEEIPDMYRRVVKHYMKASRMIEQFTQGLNDGLWDVMRSHWEAFAPVITSVGSRPLTLENFRALFTVGFSSDGEEREKERETAAHWDTALGLISDGGGALTFEDLLIFISGVKQVPPLGFCGSITLRFYSQDSVPSIVRLPFASTCTRELFLPRGVDGAVELLGLLTRAVHESGGFTCLSPEEERCIKTTQQIDRTSQDEG